MCKNVITQLTVIIPFLNEGEEVKNTLQSIRTHGGEEVAVMLINDGSDDGVDYESWAKDWGADYIYNPERLGVAHSRDIGVERCATPYFLLLDAHMRFYQDNWIQILVEELEKDNRVLLCCNTRVLRKNDKGEMYEDLMAPRTFGARVHLVRDVDMLNAKWTAFEKNPKEGIEDIACVLGAAYACGKNYWQYLKGLEGLISYGSDEPYISLKVWLEGGKCRLLKNLFVGHYYRPQAPYPIDKNFTIYNKLLISYLLLPWELQINFEGMIQSCSSQIYLDILGQLMEQKEKLDELKAYYKRIFTRSFDEVIALNSIPQVYRGQVEKDDERLTDLFYNVLLNCNTLPSLGIEKGRMGCILFIASYAHYKQNELYEDLAAKLIDSLYANIHKDIPITWADGLCGMAYGITWLLYHNLVEGDVSDVLSEIDALIMEREPRRITDYSRDSGLAGILYYVLFRLQYWQEHEDSQKPFDLEYLNSMECAAREALKHTEYCESWEMARLFILFRDSELSKLNIPSLLSFLNLTNIDIFCANEENYGLKIGYSGWGVSLLRKINLC